MMPRYSVEFKELHLYLRILAPQSSPTKLAPNLTSAAVAPIPALQYISADQMALPTATHAAQTDALLDTLSPEELEALAAEIQQGVIFTPAAAAPPPLSRREFSPDVLARVFAPIPASDAAPGEPEVRVISAGIDRALFTGAPMVRAPSGVLETPRESQFDEDLEGMDVSQAELEELLRELGMGASAVPEVPEESVTLAGTSVVVSCELEEPNQPPVMAIPEAAAMEEELEPEVESVPVHEGVREVVEDPTSLVSVVDVVPENIEPQILKEELKLSPAKLAAPLQRSAPTPPNEQITIAVGVALEAINQAETVDPSELIIVPASTDLLATPTASELAPCQSGKDAISVDEQLDKAETAVILQALRTEAPPPVKEEQVLPPPSDATVDIVKSSADSLEDLIAMMERENEQFI